MNRILILIFLMLYIWAFFIEPNLLTVTKYKVEGLGGKKIIFATDFHISKHDKKRLEKIVDLINSQNPDLVLMGGDFMKGHNGKNSLPIEEQVKILKEINAPIVTVLGNHDGWFGKEKVRQALANAGITVLENSNTFVDGLCVAGVEDLQTGNPDVSKALAGTKSPCILLTHTPDVYYDVKDDVDLIFAGHVHGGQVYLPIVGALIVPSKYGSKFAKGVIGETQNKMIISKGLGTSILPCRFMAVPEIVVIE